MGKFGGVCRLLAIVAIVFAAYALPGVSAELPHVDVYVLPTTVTGTVPCTPTDSDDADAVLSLIQEQLSGNYDVAFGTKKGPNYLSTANYAPKMGAHVIIATACKMGNVYSITLNGYSLTDPPTGGLLRGTFDTLATADWTSLFGSTTLYPNAAFLPVPNDTNNFVNPRLIRNLPITLIATPAPAPVLIAPPLGYPPLPLPPTTRLKECQASAYQMLIVGRSLITSTSGDISRILIGGVSLQWDQPKWAPLYQGLGILLGLLYSPASAEVSTDFYICPKQHIVVPNPKDPNGPPLREYDKDTLYTVGARFDSEGKYIDHHITGHNTKPAVGTDPYATQGATDRAIIDLASQLDCIIYHELEELRILDFQKLQQALYPNETVGSKCSEYYRKVKALEGRRPGT